MLKMHSGLFDIIHPPTRCLPSVPLLYGTSAGMPVMTIRWSGETGGERAWIQMAAIEHNGGNRITRLTEAAHRKFHAVFLNPLAGVSRKIFRAPHCRTN